MESIKNFLIKLLGGYTDCDIVDEFYNGHQCGQLYAARRIREQMKDCNGMSAEEWCDFMWFYTDNLVKETEKEIKESLKD